MSADTDLARIDISSRAISLLLQYYEYTHTYTILVDMFQMNLISQFPHLLSLSVLKTVVTCKIKHLQKCFRATGIRQL